MPTKLAPEDGGDRNFVFARVLKYGWREVNDGLLEHGEKLGRPRENEKFPASRNGAREWKYGPKVDRKKAQYSRSQL